MTGDVPVETRRELGTRDGRFWAATAPLDEKVRLWEMFPDPNTDHDSRCAQVAHSLKKEIRDPNTPERWPTLSPLLRDRGLTETLSDTDAWLAGFLDGALDVMGVELEAGE